ncbi:MAG: glycerate kinase [Verrucomicrobiota bacterium]|nr:glycerate kinase [Verrucomicrobiota bacterium]
MRFLIAPDKFKGSLDAAGVASAIALGLRDVIADAEIVIAPMADGGEGTAETIVCARGGEWVNCAAHDALGGAIEARYGWLRESALAVLEMSEVAGMRRVPHNDVMRANTFGVGEMLLDAKRRGASEVIIGLGGSATNDGGFGLARALGFRFFAGESELVNGISELRELTRIARPSALAFPKIVAAVDVKDPLLGGRGATRMFAPQKGATPAQIKLLESALANLANVVARDLGCDFRDVPGAGAAGGLGFGLMSFCGAEIRSGFEVVAEAIGLEGMIGSVDVVITGEGKLDAQTLEGKAPAGVAWLARKLGKRVYAIVGEAIDENASALFDGVLPILRASMSRTLAIKLTERLLRERAAELASALTAPSNKPARGRVGSE